MIDLSSLCANDQHGSDLGAELEELACVPVVLRDLEVPSEADRVQESVALDLCLNICLWLQEESAPGLKVEKIWGEGALTARALQSWECIDDSFHGHSCFNDFSVSEVFEGLIHSNGFVFTIYEAQLDCSLIVLIKDSVDNTCEHLIVLNGVQGVDVWDWDAWSISNNLLGRCKNSERSSEEAFHF